MSRALLCGFFLLFGAACDSTDPPVPTTVTVDPPQLTFDAIGAKDTVVASVFDQRGDQMFDVPLIWTVEGGAVSVQPLTGDSAVVTSVATGSAIVRVNAEGAIGEAAAAVTQVPASINIVDGNGQTGIVGAALLAPLRVAVRDRLGVGIPGRVVTFAVTSGGGSLSSGTATTDQNGIASVTWTLGTSTAVAQEVTATTEGVAGSVTFTATPTPGPPAKIEIVAGNDQTVTAGSLVPSRPSVRVTDQFGNPVPGITVVFQVVTGGGSVTGATVTTNANGIATVGSWRLGNSAGPNTLRASVAGMNLSVTFTATGTAPAGNPTINISSGNNQAAMVNTAVPLPPSVIVRDASNNPIPGVTVTFEVIEGGGTVTGAVVTTNANGVATVGSWILGPIATLNRLRATASLAGVQNNPVIFTAAGCSGGGGAGYAITLCFTSSVTATQRNVFETAAARWSAVIAGDLQSFNVAQNSPCGAGSPRVQMTIDDLLIFAAVTSIDGPRGVLGQAGPCQIRNIGNLPFIGTMEFDSADLVDLQNNGTLQAVILHEMGHVIGIGTLWDILGLLEDESSLSVKRDTYYDGPAGIAGFDAIGGTTYTGGRKVPVENEHGEGTINSHWRENVLRNELMTGFINPGSNPLSLLTVRSLEDLGYSVNTGAADPFSLMLTVRAGATSSVHLKDDILDLPLYRVDAAGRTTRIR